MEFLRKSFQILPNILSLLHTFSILLSIPQIFNHNFVTSEKKLFQINVAWN